MVVLDKLKLRKMKTKIITLLSFILLVGSFASCIDDTPLLTEDPQNTGSDAPTNPGAEVSITHTGIITENETWSNESIHFLDNKVVVDAGAVLTIEAGTVIKGLASNDVEDASALIVARG